eukprot:7127197-Karenia_brevis.AAC.1
MMYNNMQGIETTDLGDPIDEEMVDLALHILRTQCCWHRPIVPWRPEETAQNSLQGRDPTAG